jgi:serine/threonine protein kinase
MGDLTDRYELSVTLGEGGSAVLYRARDRRLDRDVAIKRMRETGWPDVARRRFETEAQVLARLQHPHIARVFDAGQDSSGVPYIVMELLAGETLEARLTGAPVESQQVLAWAFPLLGALAVAHDAGVLHRDIKPSNLFLRDNGPAGVSPVLIDFGIAKQLGDAGHTGEGVVLGTPAFMSPEQAAGEPLGCGTDIWSLAVVLYRLLAGRLPFEGGSASEVLAKVSRAAAPPLTQTAPWVAPGLAATVDRALRPAHARPSSAREFARMLLDSAIASDIPVPQQPDPLGLPEWADWCAAALERGPTGTLLVTSPAGSPSRPRTRAARWLVGAAGLLLLSWAALSVLGRSSNASRPAEPETLASVASVSATSLNGGVVPAPAADTTDAAEAAVVTEHLTPTAMAPLREGVAEARAFRRDASARPRRSPSETVSSASVPPPQPAEEASSMASRLPDVVDSWDL